MKSTGLNHIALIGLLVLVLLALGPPASARVNAPLAPHSYQPVAVRSITHLQRVEDLVFAMTNQARQARGLAPLSRDTELRKLARAFSDDMLVRRFFSHTTPDGVPFSRRIRSNYPYQVRTLGENIWESFGYEHHNPQTLARLIMADWMKSPGHRANLLDPDYTNMGVGVSARQHMIKVTQEFVGRPGAFIFGKTPHR